MGAESSAWLQSAALENATRPIVGLWSERGCGDRSPAGPCRGGLSQVIRWRAGQEEPPAKLERKPGECGEQQDQ